MYEHHGHHSHCPRYRRSSAIMTTSGIKDSPMRRLFYLIDITVIGLLYFALDAATNLSAFAPFKGNLELTVYQLGGVIVGAGFGEEYLFRGFLFQRLAMLFGGSKLGWGMACLIQAALFGFARVPEPPRHVAHGIDRSH